MGLALLWLLLWLLLVALPLVLGIYLIWKQTRILRFLGLLILLMLTYRQIHWVSPWYVIGGGERVQEFKLHDLPFGSNPSVRWMNASNQLILVPDEKVIFIPEPPEYNHVLVVDLEARKSHWQPKAEIDLARTTPVEYLPTTPSTLGTKAESSFIGFSLPFLVYQIPWPFGETHGWQWEKTYFGYWREVVGESQSGLGVVKMIQVVFNAPRSFSGATGRSVIEGKFVIVVPDIFTDRRVFALGPFNTSQDTQSKDNKHKE